MEHNPIINKKAKKMEIKNFRITEKQGEWARRRELIKKDYDAKIAAKKAEAEERIAGYKAYFDLQAKKITDQLKADIDELLELRHGELQDVNREEDDYKYEAAVYAAQLRKEACDE